LGRLRLKYPTQTTVLFRHFPLVNAHAFAFSAAVAAECAAEQGRFVAYHDLLFQNQKRFTDTLWQSLATQANVLDSARFARCLGRDETADRVNRDIAAGNELGVTGTPTVLVGDMRLLGAPSFAKLDTIVQKALRR